MRSPIAQLRTLFAPLIAVPILLWVVMSFVLGSAQDAWSEVEMIWLGVLVVASIFAVTVIHLLGYRANTTTASNGVEAFRSLAMLRFAMAEAPMLIGLALGFVAFSGGMLLVTVGAVVSLLLMAVHVWPNDRQIEKVQASLDQNGPRVRLREAMYAESSAAGR